MQVQPYHQVPKHTFTYISHTTTLCIVHDVIRAHAQRVLADGPVCLSSGSDSYFTLQTLLGTPQLLLKPRLDCRPSLHINLCLSHNNLESEVRPVGSCREAFEPGGRAFGGIGRQALA